VGRDLTDPAAWWPSWSAVAGPSGGLEAICWRYRVGALWRDLPAEFGPWQTVWKRHFRWSTDGTYERIFQSVQGRDQGIDAELAALLSVDSTSVRVHQHAAGAVRSQNTGGTIELQEIRE